MAIHYFYTFPCPKNPKPTFLNSSLIWIYNLVKENMLAPKIVIKVKPPQSLGKWENNISKQTLPMSSWSYKVKTAVYSGVNDVSSIEA